MHGYFLILFCIFSSLASAEVFTSYEKKRENYFEISDQFKISLTSLPKVENQSNLEFCAAFSSRALLEQYHCKNNRNNCEELTEDEKFSVLDIASYKTPTPYFLDKGGSVTSILKNIRSYRNQHKISVESCASYKRLKYNLTSHVIDIDGKNPKTSIAYTDVMGGWKYLEHNYYLFQKISLNEQTDIVDLVKNNLGLESDSAFLLKAFSNRNGLSSFYFHALIPKNCRQESSARSVLEYVPQVFPKLKRNRPKRLDYLAQIYKLLKNDIPLNINFCAQKIFDPETQREICTYHGTIIKGIKKVCRHDKDCELLVQLHNSYGEKWQQEFNDGWIRAIPLLKNLWPGDKLNWIEGPQEKLVGLTKEESNWLRSDVAIKIDKTKILKGNIKSSNQNKDIKKGLMYKCGKSYVDFKINNSCKKIKR